MVVERSRGLKITISGLALSLNSCGFALDAQRITPPTQMVGATLNSQSAEESGSLSFDGGYLVFASDRLSQRSIFLYDTRSRQLIDLPGLNQQGVRQDQPDISADGRYIVYISEQQGKPDVFIYDRQTMFAQQLTRDFLGELRNPSISGNGRFIAFESNRSGQWDIEILDRGVTSDL